MGAYSSGRALPLGVSGDGAVVGGGRANCLHIGRRDLNPLEKSPCVHHLQCEICLFRYGNFLNRVHSDYRGVLAYCNGRVVQSLRCGSSRGIEEDGARRKTS